MVSIMVTLASLFATLAGVMSGVFEILEPVALILAILCMIKYLRNR